MSALAKRAPRRREPVYMRMTEVIIPGTGEIKAGFIAADPREADALRRRKLSIGDVYRIELHKPRNPKHHRLVMATLQVLVDAVDGIDTIDQALMLVKIGMGYADPIIDAATGRTTYVLRSISFDSMGQDDFDKFHVDLLRFITKRYLPTMTPADLERMAELMAGSDG